MAGSHTGALNAQSVNLTNSNNLTLTANDFVDGSSVLLTNVDNSTFSNNTLTGSHTPSTFTGLRLGTGSDNMTVTGNSFLNRGTSAFSSSQLDNLTFSNNVVTFDVSVVAINTIRAIASFNGLKGTSSIIGNSITLSGVMPSGAAVHGMEVSGNNTATVNVTQNSLNGGNTDSMIAAGHDSYGLGLLPTGFGLPNPVVTVVNATNNIISGWVDGVAFTNFSGAGQPVGVRTTLSVNNNNLDGNQNKALRAANTGAVIDASANWYGSAVPATVDGKVSGSAIDYTPYLNLGTDTSGTAGFQGDFSSLSVHASGNQFGATPRIQEGIGLVTASGTVKVIPGTYSGNVDATSKAVTLAAGASPGQVTVTGSFALNSDDTLPIEIDGTSAATQYDNFIINGSPVALGNASLALSGTHTPVPGQTFTIIDNDLADAISGTFNGLPEGAIIPNFLGSVFGAQISYTGGSGNDVVLTVVEANVSVAVAPTSVLENGATTLDYTFTRSGVTTGTLTVNFTVGGSAIFGTDYTQTGAASFTTTTGTVTFSGSNTTAVVTIDPTPDTDYEPDETVVLTVVVGSGYSPAAPTSATGTITNDDACPAFSTVYVDDSWVGTAIGDDPDAGGPATSFGCDSFATIQDGINGVTSGGTVIVCAGNYPENVLVNKSVTLNGPNAGIDPNTGSRVAEAVVRPAVTETSVQSLDVGHRLPRGHGQRPHRRNHQRLYHRWK